MKNEKLRVTSAQIIVTGTKEKPYYEIKYRESGKENYCIGYSSYCLDNVFEWLEECFDLVEDKNVEQRWILVSERVPEDGTYLTTLDGELVGQEEPFTGMCGVEDGKWDEEGCVIAWMPLPEPYRESEVDYAPMTNADRIRSMTDEELADFLKEVKEDYQWANPDYPDCEDRGEWLNWLQSEAEMEENDER